MRQFPVLWQGDRDYQAKLVEFGCPKEVPWDFIEEHRAACLRNHDQTPTELARRGGLAPEEIIAAIEGNENWKARRACWQMKPEQSVPRLLELLAAWNQKQST